MDDTVLDTGRPTASDRIGPYRIVRILGRGAVEIRCLARDTRRDRDVVLEVLPLVMSRRRDVVERLSHLADVVRQLRHPGLVRLLRFEVDEQQPDLAYFVWQHVPGRTLEEVLAEAEGGLPIERVGAWAAQLAEAVDHLDDHGPGHGGIHPSNIVIDEEDNAWLGGAVVWREVRRLYGQVTGRAAPADGDRREPRRDVVDLALVVYAALCGSEVFDASSSRPEPIPGLSAQLNMALMEALDPEAAPFIRAEELVRALEGAPLRDPVPPTARPRPVRRRSSAPLLTGVAVSALAMSAVVWLWNLYPPPPATGLLRDATSLAAPLLSGSRRAPETAAAAMMPAHPGSRAEPLPEPAAPLPEVAEPTLAAAEQLALDARGEAERVGRSRRPGVAATLSTAGLRLVEAADARVAGRRAAALAAYEAAALGYERAVLNDALAATVARLGEGVGADLAVLRDSGIDDLDGPVAVVAGLHAAGAAAYATGAVAEANLQWHRARGALESLRPLAGLIEAAALARDRWRREIAAAPQPWAESLLPSVEATLAAAARAEELHERGAWSPALASWEGAAARLERLVAAHRVEVCEVTELAEVWRALRASPADAGASSSAADVRSRRVEATRLARDAELALACGSLAPARAGFAAAAALWGEASALAARRSQGATRQGSVGQTIVYLEGGRFTMGSPPGEAGRDPSETQRPVELPDGFWISTTEITRAQFAAFVAATGYRTDAERRGWSHGFQPDGAWRRMNGLSWRQPGFAQDDDHPVVCVSYNDARAFCAWLGERESRAYRLPTEAEWEYACRAGAGTAFHWGDEPSGGAGFENGADASWSERFDEPEAFPWTDGCVFTCAVASGLANPWGLYDLHGNVQEWCRDAYVASEDPPTGAVDAASPRVIRGGSFAVSPRRCRAAHRDASTPATSFATLGFRVVMEPMLPTMAGP